MASSRFVCPGVLILGLAFCGAFFGTTPSRGATLAERAAQIDWFERYVYGAEIPKLPKQLYK